MKRLFISFVLASCIAIGARAQNNIDSLSTDDVYEWKDSMSYEERERWVKSLMDKHYALLAKESCNFNSVRPYLISKIEECDAYYAIEVIDSTRIFHYTVVSPKTKKTKQRSKKDIAVGSVYYLNLRALTKYTGKIGCSEMLYDISFEVNGKRVRYISTDVLDGPPVCTENLNELRYVKKMAIIE